MVSGNDSLEGAATGAAVRNSLGGTVAGAMGVDSLEGMATGASSFVRSISYLTPRSSVSFDRIDAASSTEHSFAGKKRQVT